MATPRSKAQKQFTLIEAAKFNLEKALDRLDYFENVVEPGLERIAALERAGVEVTIRQELAPIELPELPKGDVDA